MLATKSASTVVPPERITLEEFWRIPEGPPNFEFEDGELIAMVSPHGKHQEIVLQLGGALSAHVRRAKLGKVWPEIDVYLPSVNRVYIPDLVYLSADKLGLFTEPDGKIHGTPDLVVELLSPSTKRRDRTTKQNAYQKAGVPWYWIVDVDDLTIEELKLTPEGYLIAQSVARGHKFLPGLFPGLEIDLVELLGEEAEPEEDRDDVRPTEND
ncbi:MAG: Uma2 family endonuclease [Chloroflexota bacterium]